MGNHYDGPGAVPVTRETEFLKGILDCLEDGVYCVDTTRQITYWNRGAERINGYTGEEVIGKHCWDDILGHVDEEGNSLFLGGCALTSSISDGQSREMVAYLHNKAGHRVPVQMRVVPIRGTGGQVTGAVEIFSDDFTRAESHRRIQELEKMAYLDELTGLANRRFAEISVQQALSEMRRYGWPFGLVMMDLDDFKATNDEFGHCVQDEVLRMAGRTPSGSSRPSDVIGRWGGDEFLAIVKNAGEDQLKKVAEKYRHLVAASGLVFDGKTIQVTLSAGAAAAESGDSDLTLLAKADREMYQHKKPLVAAVSQFREAPRWESTLDPPPLDSQDPMT